MSQAHREHPKRSEAHREHPKRRVRRPHQVISHPAGVEKRDEDSGRMLRRSEKDDRELRKMTRKL